MIPLSALKDLFMNLPNSRINEPSFYSQYHDKEMPTPTSDLIDSKGVPIGNINWRDGVITIYDGYQYSDQIREAIGDEKFSQASDFDAEKEIAEAESKLDRTTAKSEEMIDKLYSEPQ